jgi:hypothetical protein
MNPEKSIIRKVASAGLVAGAVIALAQIRPQGAVASQQANLNMTAPSNLVDDGIPMTECHEDRVTISTEYLSPATESSAVLDPNADWIENTTSQEAIDTFWSQIGSDNSEVVGAQVDLRLKKFSLIIGSNAKSPAFEKFVNELSVHVPAELLRSCRTRASLNDDMKIVSHWVEGGHFDATMSLSIDEMTASVQVEVDSEESALQIVNAETLRNLPLRVVITGAVPVPLSRCPDSAPHYGGALFSDATDCVGGCTSGVKVRRNSDLMVGMATAGHCRVTTGWSGNLYSGYSFFGAFSNWSFGGGNDWAFVTASTYSPNFYTDPCCPSVRTNSGSANPVVGNSLCISGAVTTARCSMIVQDTAYQNYYKPTNVWVTNTQATRSDGTVACQEGDSGGPWYSAATSKVYGLQSFGTSAGGPTCYFNQISRMLTSGYQILSS